MRRIKLEIAYDGTRYCGWQVQPEEITVEGLINEKLSQLLGEKIEVIGASRTDSGVHAMGNVAVFDTNSSIPAEKFAKALNVRLPEDIRVQTSCEAPIDFHPRRTECVKTYEYRIQNRKIEMPMDRLYSYFVYVDLDIEAMQRAAEYLVGTHDYKSFCSVKTQVLDTVRTIYSIKVSKKEDIIYIRIKGNGFLYNMVRIIVGTLINVGRGFHSPEKVLEILKACDRSLAGPTAPAKGLTLVKIEYNI